jgi:methylmalonyl-CoA/ethylmalonyl-CoA epimerase
MIIDHSCFAVKDLKEGIGYWENIFGYRQMTQPVDNTRQQVKVVFLQKENSLPVKLIELLPGNTSLEKFTDQGGGFHHICFKCADLQETNGDLKSKGVRMLVPPQPGKAFGNHDIAFMWGRNKINFELIDTDVRAGKLP